MPSYEFEKQLLSGKAGEWVMEKYHAPYYKIEKTGITADKLGYDFVFGTAVRDWMVEVKTDFKSQDTGNIIIETESRDNPYKAGWAITSQSDVLIYYLWYMHKVLYFWMSDIKQNVQTWVDEYGEIKIKNTNKRGVFIYNTIGIKLPVRRALRVTFNTRYPIDPQWMKKNYRHWLTSQTK